LNSKKRQLRSVGTQTAIATLLELKIGPKLSRVKRQNITIEGAFYSTKTSGNSGLWSEWNRHFPEFLSEILGVPREVGLKFQKIGITGKFRSIRLFLLGSSFTEPGNRNSTWLILKLLNIILVLYQTND